MVLIACLLALLGLLACRLDGLAEWPYWLAGLACWLAGLACLLASRGLLACLLALLTCWPCLLACWLWVGRWQFGDSWESVWIGEATTLRYVASTGGTAASPMKFCSHKGTRRIGHEYQSLHGDPVSLCSIAPWGGGGKTTTERERGQAPYCVTEGVRRCMPRGRRL